MSLSCLRSTKKVVSVAGSNTIITVLESYQVVLIENTGGESHFSERLECVGSNDEKTKSPLVPLMTMTNGFVGCQSVLSIETPEAVHGAIFLL